MVRSPININNSNNTNSYLVQYKGGTSAIITNQISDTECHKNFDKLMKDEIDSIRSGSNTNTELLHIYCIP